MPDPEKIALMRVFPLGEAQAVEWYTALRESCARAPDDFDEAITALGAATSHIVSPAELALFVEELDRLAADRMEFLRRFAEEDPHDLAAHHSAEHQAAEHQAAEHQAEQPAEEGPFDWVPAEQAERMAQAWGQDWPDALAPQLAHAWGEDWWHHPADHKAAWLPELLDTLLSHDQPSHDQLSQNQPSPDQPSGAAGQGRFDWVPAEQAERMTQAWGQDWPEVLGPQLDYRWGQGWEAHPADDKAAWLPALVDELLTPADTAPADTAPADTAPADTAPVDTAPTGEPPAAEAQPAADSPEPQGAGDISAEDIKAAVDEVVAEIPGAENLTEAELRRIRADVAAALAAALAAEPAPAG